VNFDSIGGRRYVLAQQVFLASCLLLAFGKISGGEWVTVTLGIAGVYVAGNVSQRKIEAEKPA
jgi:hypothetical protein